MLLNPPAALQRLAKWQVEELDVGSLMEGDQRDDVAPRGAADELRLQQRLLDRVEDGAMPREAGGSGALPPSLLSVLAVGPSAIANDVLHAHAA